MAVFTVNGGVRIINKEVFVMKKKLFVLLAAVVVMALSLQATVLAEGGEILDGRWLCTDIDGNVTQDTPAELKDDFNLYVNKDWYIETSIPDGQQTAGSVPEAASQVRDILIGLLKDDSLSSHDAQLVQKLYHLLVDWDYRNDLGLEPAMPYIEKLKAIDSLESLFDCAFSNDTVVKYLPVAVEVSYDLVDPDIYITWIEPVKLLLQDSAEYTTRTQAGDMYYTYCQKHGMLMLPKFGFSEEEAGQIIDNAMAFEALLAAHIKPKADHYLADYDQSQANYYDIEELKKLAGDFPVMDMLEESGFSGGSRFLVPEPDSVASLADIYIEDNVPLIRDWMLLKSVIALSALLDQETYKASTDIANALQGTSGDTSDDDYALGYIETYLKVPLDNLYIQNCCTEQQKQEITDLINEILSYYHDMLASTEWLSEATREKAVEKLEAIRVFSVYPDQMGDWSGLDFNGVEEKGNLVDAVRTINSFKTALEAARIDQPVDKDNWDQQEIPTYETNASYNPSLNVICVRAGFLGGEYYNENMSYEQKLAGVGTTIGHEISHAFDTSGAQYDKDGALSNWWTQEDYDAFQARAVKLAAWYDGFIPYEGISYSGQQVQTEAIADMAGLKCILSIAAQEEDFDYDAFFTQYAKAWRMKELTNFFIRNIATDVHPLFYMRINANLAQYDDFTDFYDIEEGDGMYIAPEDRVAVW